MREAGEGRGRREEGMEVEGTWRGGGGGIFICFYLTGMT